MYSTAPADWAKLVDDFIFKQVRVHLFAHKYFQVLLITISSSIYQVFQSDLKLIICLLTVKWFQVLLFNSYNSI